MKEIESSQEVVLLRDAIITATSQGADFADKESSENCAKIIKEAVADVEIMLEVDSDDPGAKNEARNAMHTLLYYKTLMTSNDLSEEEVRYCKYACESLPDICWQTYAGCISECGGWMDIAQKIWSSDSVLVRNVVLDRLLTALRDARRFIPDSVDTYYVLLKAKLNSTEDPKLALDSVAQHLRSLKTSHKNTPAMAEPDSARRTDTITNDATAETALRRLVKIFKMLHAATAPTDDPEVVYAVENCVEAVRRIVAATRFKDSPSLVEFLHFVQTAKSGQSGRLAEGGGEALVEAYIRSVGARDFMHEAAVEKLLIRLLLEEADPEVINCLEVNAAILKPHHVSSLLFQSQTAKTEDAAKIQRVALRAFSGWDLAAQESFLGRWHQEYGFRDFVLADVDFPQALTAAINMLSAAAGGQETAVAMAAAKEMAPLCLQSPVVTLSRLFDFAVRSGQAEMTAQILRLLETSFCFPLEDGVRFSLECLSRGLLSSELTAQELVGMLNLVRALIEAGVLLPAELVSNCVAPHLHPSEECHRFLQLIRVIVLSAGPDRAFETTALPVVLLRLCRLLHVCATADLAVIEWDLPRLKEPLLAALDAVLPVKSSDAEATAKHARGMCWLWTKLGKMESGGALPYMLDSFAAHGLERKCVEQVKRMSVPWLLLCCLHLKNEDSEMLKECCRRRLRADRVAATSAVVQILDRLFPSEVHALLRELVFLFASESTAEADLAPLVGVSMLLDSLLMLSARDRRQLPDHPWNRVVQSCVTGIKAFLRGCEPMSSRSLPLLATIVSHVAEESGRDLGAAVGIFLLDLVVRAPPSKYLSSYALPAINRLGDAQLTHQAVKVLESKKRGLISR